jgi:hypothetical protein
MSHAKPSPLEASRREEGEVEREREQREKETVKEKKTKI